MPVEYCDSGRSADHTLHSHALFTSSLAFLCAFTKAGHKPAGFNERQESNIDGGAATAGSHDHQDVQRRPPAFWKLSNQQC